MGHVSSATRPRRKTSASHSGEPAAQTTMWGLGLSGTMNMVALYDLAPRFLFDSAGSREGNDLLEREFTFDGRRYSIALGAATFRMPSGELVTKKFLGEREQIVEEVIRRLACMPGRLALDKNQNVIFSFSIYEIRQELRRIRHTYSSSEVIEAIFLLNQSRITIRELDKEKAKPMLLAAAFPVLMMRDPDDDSSENYLEFNPLVVHAIRNLTFVQVDYEAMMGLRDPIARWLVKRLSVQASLAKHSTFRLSSADIFRDTGMREWKSRPNMFRRVNASVDALVGAGVVDTYTRDQCMRGRALSDIVFSLTMSPEFMTKSRKARRVDQENQREFCKVSGLPAPNNKFFLISEADVVRLTASRAQEQAVLEQ